IGALKDSLAHLTREGRVVELDVLDVDPSPFPDRLDPHDGGATEAALTQSIRINGQEVPVLVRPHPTARDRYQIVYGHRRLRAVAAIGGRKLRAVIRDLSDADLLLAQGIENSAREDLSWIEKAVFAARLERFAADNGIDPTRMVTQALAIHAPDASRFRTTLEAVPADVIDFIGTAPKVGRTKWLALADALRTRPIRLKTVRAVLDASSYGDLSSDRRFDLVLKAALSDKVMEAEAQGVRPLVAEDASELGSLQEFARGARLQLADKGFARFLADRIDRLHAEYKEKSEVIPGPGERG
uniref:plasmid partitioning protein RepB n=1 Tax=Oryzibacter oryziterrae TaxID=2766474 RepID=UPI001F00149E